jgi:hypothetical protein
VRTVLTVMERPEGLDVARDGTVYVDQPDNVSQVVRYLQSSPDRVERLPLPATHEDSPVLPIDRGRLLVKTRSGGRNRLMIMSTGKDPVPFVETAEETSSPMARLGGDSVVFLAGTAPTRHMVGASIADGRIVRRFGRVNANQPIASIAGSPDGKAIFFVAARSVWGVADDDAEPQRIRDADSIAIAPDGREVDSAERNQRHPSGAPDAERRCRTRCGAARERPPDAVDAGTECDLQKRPPRPAYYTAGQLVLAGGDRRSAPRSVELLPNASTTDMFVPGWDDQERVVTIGNTMARGTLWRFQAARPH